MPPSSSPTFLYTLIAIIAGAIVSLLAIIIIIAIIVVCVRRHKKEVSPRLANRPTDGAVYEEICKNAIFENYEEVGKGSTSYDYTKPRDFNMDNLQANSAYGVIQNDSHIYMDANKL